MTRPFLALLLCLATALPLRADPPPAHDGWALAGHDPVAYFRDGAAREGQADQAVKWRGQTWHFASAENRAAFEADPGRFAPRFRGYCAAALADGDLTPGRPEVFAIHDGRLYLFQSAARRDAFLADPELWLGQAEQMWQALSRR